MLDYGDLETGQVAWYEFRNNSDICVIEGNHILHHPVISNCTCRVCYVKYKELASIGEHVFDYVVLLDVIGYFQENKSDWEIINQVTKQESVLLVIANNRFGIKYFCGDYDENSQMPFNGINNYPFKDGRRDYDRQGLIDLVTENGFGCWKFYYPIPDFRLLQVVYTDNMLPKEDFMERVIFTFEHTEALIVDERDIYKDIIKNGVFPFFSNSFILECSKNKVELCDVNYAAVSIDRSKENAFITAIHEDKHVTKTPIFTEGKVSIQKLQENMEYLNAKGVPVLGADYSSEKIVMDYVQSPTLANYLRELCDKKNREAIIEIFDRLYEYILMSSEKASAEENVIKNLYGQMDWGIILKRTFLELIPMNCFYEKGRFIFFDQEFVYDNYPALYPLFRGLRYTYKCINNMNALIPRSELCKRYRISEVMWNAFEAEEQKMQICIKQRKTHKIFYQNIYLNKEALYKKALLEDYLSRNTKFADFFQEKGDYILFGTGICAEKFMHAYGSKCSIIKVVDNNSMLWGTWKWGYIVESPNTLAELDPNERKVIICTNNKDYIQIARQLEKMNIKDYCQCKL